MRRSRVRLLATAILAALAIIAAAVLFSPPSGGAQAERLLALAGGVALILSAAAAAFAFVALRRAERLAAEMRRLTASVDTALRTRLNAEKAGAEPALPEKSEATPAAATPQPTRAPTETAMDVPDAGRAEPAHNVVRLSNAAGLRRRERPSPRVPAASILTVLAEDDPELSLQPIVSATTGRTHGFDVFRRIVHDGAALDIRRLAEPPQDFDTAAFERQLTVAAIHAARRRLGGSTDQPLHVAVSDALLASPRDLRQILDMARDYPLIGGLLVFSARAPLFETASPAAAALSQLAAAGFGLAAEAEGGPLDAALASSALRYLRIPAHRLTRAKASQANRAGDLLASAVRARIPVIATDVAHDRDAVALIDLGVDLMVGDRFSGPRRLKPEQGARSSLPVPNRAEDR